MGSRSARPDLGWARHSSPSIPVGVYRFRSATDRFSARFSSQDRGGLDPRSPCQPYAVDPAFPFRNNLGRRIDAKRNLIRATNQMMEW
jgi:hypothetical protein